MFRGALPTMPFHRPVGLTPGLEGMWHMLTRLTDTLNFQGQALSLPMIALGLWFALRARK